MELTAEKRVELLESLVDELLKENPIEFAIQTKMTELKIEYTDNQVLRINRVLETLHTYQSMDFETSDFEEMI